MQERLDSMLRSEKVDFSVKAGRSQPRRTSGFIILFGIGWLAFTSIFIVAFFGPLFFGREVHFTTNGVPTVAGPDNLAPMLLPGLIIGLFVVIGLIILGVGIFQMNKKGGYFVGTPNRLIHYYRGNFRSIDWEQFSGDILLTGNEQRGNISFRLRTGKMVSQKNGPDRYVPEIIHISDIPNAFEIEELCRKRIKENDPTPPRTID